jgi:class 3 adenylate cyclase
MSTRRLAAILATDVVGCSAMIGCDELGTLARVRGLRSSVIEPLAATHEGRLFKTTGDGFFVEFASAVQALRCATAIQDTLHATGPLVDVASRAHPLGRSVRWEPGGRVRSAGPSERERGRGNRAESAHSGDSADTAQAG